MKGPSKQPLVRFDNVSIGYGTTPMLSGIDLRVHRGDVLAIVGPNGAGKSTLLKTIVGILAPVAGSIERRSGLRVGYVPQRSVLDSIFPLTAFEVVRLGGFGVGNGGGALGGLRGAPPKDVWESLDHLGVADLAKFPFRELSGGQQQRVLIARALVRKPELLVLDEPTTGMDITAEQALLDFITHLNDEHSVNVVLVVHQLEVAAHRASRFAFVNKDREIFAEGSREDLLREERIGELFGQKMNFHWCTHGDTSELIVRPSSKEVHR